MTWEMWAVKTPNRKGKFNSNPNEYLYLHCHKSKWWVELWPCEKERGESLVKINVTEDPEGYYFSWVYTGVVMIKNRDGVPQMVQPNFTFFGMQFTYGVKAELESEHCDGKVVRLTIEEVNENG